MVLMVGRMMGACCPLGPLLRRLKQCSASSKLRSATGIALMAMLRVDAGMPARDTVVE